jgi:cytochrome c peroxidase
VPLTAPYFHDGSQETLWDVMDHYNKGDGLQNPYLDEDIQPLALTEDDNRRRRGASRVAHERGLQGAGDQGAGAPINGDVRSGPPRT